MAAKDDAEKQIETFAFRLFIERTARNPGRDVGHIAIGCYRDAEAFMSISDKIRSGEVEVAAPVGPQLADACAPNLDETHPLNIVSKRFGSLDLAKQIHKELLAKPGIEELPKVAGAGGMSIVLNWGKPEVNLARTILPTYVQS
jgi:hypothetical protein